MSDSEYKLVTSKTPIPTVDLVVLRKRKTVLETLLLIRKTGYAKGEWCIIGGRQWINEKLSDTIKRQAKDLGVQVEIIHPFSPNFPSWIDDNPLQDKTKHSCSHVYPVKIVSGKVRKEGEEFTGFKWFSINNLPKLAYDHKIEIQKTIKQVKKFNKRLSL